MAKKILVPLDFSDVTDRVLDEAIRIARQDEAATWLIHVAAPKSDFVGYDVGPAYIRDSVAQDLRLQHQQLDRCRERFLAEGLEATSLLLAGVATHKIVEEMGRIEPDLVIMGSHGHGALYHLLMGSVATSVVKNAACPVLIVPAVPPAERMAVSEAEHATAAES